MTKSSRPGPPPKKKTPDPDRLERLVAEANRARAAREQGYRERALKILPWVCGRCARSFERARLRELTVHHRDGNHDNNPPDGSNWELLCIYCHENEHAREVDARAAGGVEGPSASQAATHRPLDGLADLLKKKPRG
ncbi:MAG: HNH endonuclease [Betaproteobacteria bacterium SG8_39]|nr:MAG: HNH endonuclease [Betaproteobacteria bacterium SG8_39]